MDKIYPNRYIHYFSTTWALCTAALIFSSSREISVLLGIAFVVSIYIYIRSCIVMLDSNRKGTRVIYFWHILNFILTLILEFIVLLSRAFGYYGSIEYNVALLALLAVVVTLIAMTLLLKYSDRQRA